MDSKLMLLTLLVLIGAPVLGIVLWFKAYGGKSGERYRRRQMQGPFVPLSSEEIAEDEERIKQRKEKRGDV